MRKKKKQQVKILKAIISIIMVIVLLISSIFVYQKEKKYNTNKQILKSYIQDSSFSKPKKQIIVKELLELDKISFNNLLKEKDMFQYLTEREEDINIKQIKQGKMLSFDYIVPKNNKDFENLSNNRIKVDILEFDDNYITSMFPLKYKEIVLSNIYKDLNINSLDDIILKENSHYLLDKYFDNFEESDKTYSKIIYEDNKQPGEFISLFMNKGYIKGNLNRYVDELNSIAFYSEVNNLQQFNTYITGVNEIYNKTYFGLIVLLLINIFFYLGEENNINISNLDTYLIPEMIKSGEIERERKRILQKREKQEEQLNLF